MKFAVALAMLLVVAHAAPTPKPVVKKTPMDQVVALLAGVKSRVEADGRSEQKSYDKYACWCEDTLGKKAAAIAQAKTDVEDLTNLIIKTKADLASHTAEIAQLKKQIVENKESQREATEVRAKEYGEYRDDRSESENCIGALEAAIKVLSTAGKGKKGAFLGTLQEAQILGAVAGIKSVLKTGEVTRRFSDDQIAAVLKFAEKPEEYIGGHTGFSGAQVAQVANNPFGDYAPQSSQISGILKGMYDAFTADIEKDNAEESDKQKSHEALLATKKAELETLVATLEKQELDAAQATKTLADSKETLDDTKEQLEADETFFADTKGSCQTKAAQFSERTRLRTEEISGMNQAIAIMSSAEAKKTFASATTTFLQLSSVQESDRLKAYGRVKQLATTYKSLTLAKIAVAIKTSGHFDKVITMIDTMIGMMRKEEAEDIAHRDRCESKQNANANSRDDLDSEITKSKAALARMGNTKADMVKAKTAVEAEIKATKTSMAELLQMRNKETKEYTQAQKDDADAVSLIGQAIAVLSKFYADNKIAFAQQPAPEIFKDDNYGGSKSETGGILAILDMLREDLSKELKAGSADEAESQADYEKDRNALQDTLDAQMKKKSDVESSLADLGSKIEDADEDKDNKAKDLVAEQGVQKSLGTDCAWVKVTFKKRNDKRKLEVDGLVEAKEFLAGVESGAPVLPPSR